MAWANATGSLTVRGLQGSDNNKPVKIYNGPRYTACQSVLFYYYLFPTIMPFIIILSLYIFLFLCDVFVIYLL